MSTYKQRDIALVPFPFSDLSGRKARPVLILSNDTYNQESADVLVCGLTTNLRRMPYSVIISADDVEQPCTLRHRSRIKADTIVSLQQSLLIKPIARLRRSVFKQVVVQIKRLIGSP